jgi:hypothetical protein
MHLFGAFELDIRPGTPNNPASVMIPLLRFNAVDCLTLVQIAERTHDTELMPWQHLWMCREPLSPTTSARLLS